MDDMNVNATEPVAGNINTEKNVNEAANEALNKAANAEAVTADVKGASKKSPKKRSKFAVGTFLSGILVGVSVAALVAIGFMIFILVRYSVKAPSQQQVQVEPSYLVLDDATAAKIQAIQNTFVVNSILDLDVEEMRRSMIDGLIEGTGDKYAKYYSAEEFTALMTNYEGSFYGIGAVFAMGENGLAEVQSVYKDSPAEGAGLREGDLLIKVDGVDATGMSLDEATDNIRGEKGVPVTLTIYREGEPDYLELTIIRDEIKPTVVEYELLEGHIGFVHIKEWYDTTPEQFAAAMDDLRAQGMDALIIDLRSNTGGLLTSVEDVARQLLPEGLIVYTEDAYGNRKESTCDGKQEIDIPVVILTNGYTASASEILTGAMKDHGKAYIIGTKTYGKGVVQGFHQFEDGSAIKLTIEQYFTPNGIAIDGVGISPDLEVPFDSAAYYDAEEPSDNQLQAAVDYLS